ncbi:MAG: hypothetical protein KTQ49_06325 [Candidatus Omnitrophica bacterium]|nr:hypothetical protein [Candidatus Omnitrophota bacterium]
MSSEELEYRLSQIKDKKVATEVRRFLLNLFLLFDDHPPPHIQGYITEILDTLDYKRCPVKLPLCNGF